MTVVPVLREGMVVILFIMVLSLVAEPVDDPPKTVLRVPEEASPESLPCPVTFFQVPRSVI